MGLAVVTCGHGTCIQGCTRPELAVLDSSWPGCYPGEASHKIGHVKRSVEIVAANPGAVWIPSGGDTIRETPGTEAQTMFALACDHGFWNHPEVADRSLLEHHARDTAANLGFAALLCYRKTGQLPTEMVCVGWAFKGTRVAAHASALTFLRRFEYVGANNPPAENFEAAIRGELDKLTIMVRDQDWMLKGDLWEAQRERRNPRGIPHPYADLLHLIG
jgi:hypothetical protein